MIELSVHQLMVLRSLLKGGWPATPLVGGYLLTRNGLDEAGWNQLLENGLVGLLKEGKEERWVLTKLGRSEYKKQSQGRYF